MKRYTVYVTPGALRDIKGLPGNMRQRVRQAIRDLAENPRPLQSKILNTPNFEPELYRLRLDSWRILYAITQEDNAVDVLAVRKRPPYDYGDLETLLENLD